MTLLLRFIGASWMTNLADGIAALPLWLALPLAPAPVEGM